MLNFSSTAFIQILFKNAIYATQKAHDISITKKNNLILFSNVRVCFFRTTWNKGNEPYGWKTENYWDLSVQNGFNQKLRTNQNWHYNSVSRTLTQEFLCLRSCSIEGHNFIIMLFLMLWERNSWLKYKVQRNFTSLWIISFHQLVLYFILNNYVLEER